MDALISKLLEVDPEFRDFHDQLYGVSKMDDTSEVHIPGGGVLRRKIKKNGAAKPTGDPERDKRVAQTGLAATGVATVGGLHAIKATRAEAAQRTKEVGEGTYKAGKLLGHLKPATAAKLATAGWIGLHGVELASDALGAHAQAKTIRAASQQQKVSKAAGHFQPVGLVQANARAARAGQRLPHATFRRTGATVPVGKGLFSGVQDAQRLARGVGTAEHATQHAAAARQGARNVTSHDVDDAKRAFNYRQAGARHRASTDGPKHAGPAVQHGLLKPALITGGALTAVGGGAAAGVASERKRVPQSAPGTVVNKRADCEWRGEISKVNVEKRQVFGWASLSTVDGEPVHDRQGDWIGIDEAEDAAYRYMLNSRKGGDMHHRISKLDGGPKHTADVIESMVFTAEKIEALGLEPDALPHGWWIGMQIHDDQQWQDVKDGKRTGFSVHGTGIRKDLEAVA